MYYIAIIIFIAVCLLVSYAISFVTGLSTEITMGIAFVLVILGISALDKKQKNIPKNRENDYILTWSQRGYSKALEILNKKLSEPYRITYEEESLFKVIFDGCIADKKKHHFEDNNTGIKEGVFKNEKLWLLVALRHFCDESFSAIINKEDDVLPLLSFIERYREPNRYNNYNIHTEKYQLTEMGIVAKKVLYAIALDFEGKNSAVKNSSAIQKEIDRGWVTYAVAD